MKKTDAGRTVDLRAAQLARGADRVHQAALLASPVLAALQALAVRRGMTPTRLIGILTAEALDREIRGEVKQ